MDKYCEYCKHDERHRKIKLIISIEKDLYEMIKDCVEHGQNYDYFEIIANGIPYEEKTQGEWIHYLGCGIGKAVCSECGQVGEIKKYCGNCGAYMRGNNNENL